MENYIFWSEVTNPAARKELLRFVQGLGTGLPIGGRTTRLHLGDLPFYPHGSLLVRIHDDSWPESLMIYLLRVKERLYRLAGASPPIHEAMPTPRSRSPAKMR